MTKEELCLILENYVEEDMQNIADDDDLTDVGIDSITFMSIIEELRLQNIAVTFMDLAEETTIAAWLHKIQQKTAVR
ncbi:MAG: phosphopantetheine-binding protein [Bacillus sp. (in: firmicutes)]